MYEYLVGSLGLLVIWLIIFLKSPKLRGEMLLSGSIMLPLALTEPLFVPEYWNPSTLFNLASTTGFDLESFIFVFAVGGFIAVLYETIFKTEHEKISHKEMHSKRHRFHRLVLITPFITFGLLYFFTNFNPIYSGAIASVLGAIATYFCRPDLVREMLGGGALFLILYFSFFLMLHLIFPDFIDSTWNFGAISGIKIFGVPAEELMFALTFGMFWSSFYEHVKWYKLKEM
ncbi:MAG: hypothetical protein HYW23_02485 [Candidatus Aenigmarchaeota archaeon]|nr:hypothetical protein [Candidatus Aenigmarchaeota archaeon]